jgi:hypothetical protein
MGCQTQQTQQGPECERRGDDNVANGRKRVAYSGANGAGHQGVQVRVMKVNECKELAKQVKYFRRRQTKLEQDIEHMTWQPAVDDDALLISIIAKSRRHPERHQQQIQEAKSKLEMVKCQIGILEIIRDADADMRGRGMK